MNRCSFKDKGLADLIFQETQVRKVHEFFFVDKDNKGWWFGCHLGRIEILSRFPLSVGVGLMAIASMMTSFKTADGIRVF